MIYHYDNNRSRAGTAEGILLEVERQNFDVSINVSANWNDDYKKRFTAYLTKKDGRPVMVVLDSLTPNVKESFVNPGMTAKELHEKAGYMAREFYGEFLKKILLANGFQPDD